MTQKHMNLVCFVVNWLIGKISLRKLIQTLPMKSALFKTILNKKISYIIDYGPEVNNYQPLILI